MGHVVAELSDTVTYWTPKSFSIFYTFTDMSRQANEELQATTMRFNNRGRSVRMSEIPLLKHACSGSPLTFVNGSIVMEG